MHSHKLVRYSVALALLVAVLSVVVGCELLVSFGDPGLRVCTPGARSSEGCAYGGPAGTEGVGICGPGEKVCKDDGLAWGECSAPTLPKAKEDCATPADDNCNGAVNEASAGCCTPGTTVVCYTGPAGTEGVGECKSGTRTCEDDGQTLGECTGEVKPTQEACADTLDNDCDGRECVEWAKTFGDITSQYGFTLAIDASGSILLGGIFYGTLPLGQTTLVATGSTGNAFLVKLDATGGPLWGKQFGGEVYAIATDKQENIIISGRSFDSIDLGGGAIPGGIYVAKFMADGTYVWSRWLASAYGSGCFSMVYSVAITSQGDVVAGGDFGGTLDIGDGAITSKACDAFVVKLNGNTGSGQAVDGGWSKVFGDDKSQDVAALAVDFKDNIVVACQFEGQIDFGEGTVTASDGHDAIVIKLDATGKALGYERIDGTDDQGVRDLALDATGGPVVTGYTKGSISFYYGSVEIPPGGFVARYGPDLSYGWAKALPVSDHTPTAYVAVDSTGNVALSGVFLGSIDFGDGPLTAPSSLNDPATFLAKLSGNGSVLWKRAYMSDIISVFGIGGRPAFTSNGEIILSGVMSGTVDFGGLKLTSAGNSDILVAKFGL